MLRPLKNFKLLPKAVQVEVQPAAWFEITEKRPEVLTYCNVHKIVIGSLLPLYLHITRLLKILGKVLYYLLI